MSYVKAAADLIAATVIFAAQPTVYEAFGAIPAALTQIAGAVALGLAIITLLDTWKA